MNSDDNKSWRAFTDLYPKWDAPSYDPSKYYIRPSKDSENRSVRARVWETITGTLRQGRIQILEHMAGPDKGGETDKEPLE